MFLGVSESNCRSSTATACLLFSQCFVTDPLLSLCRLGSKLLLNLFFFRSYQQTQRLQREQRWAAQEQLLQHRERLAAEALARLGHEIDSIDGAELAERVRLETRLGAIAQTRKKIQVERDLAAQQLTEKPRVVSSTGFKADVVSGRVDREAVARIDSVGGKKSYACVHPINETVAKHRERIVRRVTRVVGASPQRNRRHGQRIKRFQSEAVQQHPRLNAVPSKENILHPPAVVHAAKRVVPDHGQTC